MNFNGGEVGLSLQRRTVSSCAGRSLAVRGGWVPRATRRRHGDEWLSSTLCSCEGGPFSFHIPAR